MFLKFILALIGFATFVAAIVIFLLRLAKKDEEAWPDWKHDPKDWF